MPDREPPSSVGFTSTESLIRSLLALPELKMRVLWLEDKIFARPLPRVAPILSELCDRAQSTDERARETMLALALFFAQKRDTSLLWALREEARNQALLGLERLLRERSDPHVPEIETEVRVPDYGSSRELTVGERRTLARRPTRIQVDRLLLDPHPLVLEQLFACPSLTEDDVLRVVTRRPARLVAMELLVSSYRWMSRRRVRMGLILNPGTPHGIALPLLGTCPRDELSQVVEMATLSKTLRVVAQELLARLPPVRPALAHPFQH